MAELLAAEDDPLLKKQKNAKCGVKKKKYFPQFFKQSLPKQITYSHNLQDVVVRAAEELDM